LKKEQEKIPENAEQKESGEVSRRDFLVGAGTVVVGGAIGAGLLSSCGETVTTTIKETSTKTVATTVTAPGTTETKTVAGEDGEVITVTETKTETEPGGGGIEPAYELEKTVYARVGGNQKEISAIDIKNGKVIRIRPIHYEEVYTEEELAPCYFQLEARGKTFKSRTQSMPAYLALTYKKRVYSPNRILFPLKRIDWEPGGDPEKINAQNRGISKFKRISWEEALDTVASEIKRVQDTYGEYAVLDKSDSCHREYKIVNGSYMDNGFSTMIGQVGMTSSMRNADSWEGWYYGAKHVWQYGGGTGQINNNNVFLDQSLHTDMMIYQSCDWDTYTYGAGGWSSQVPRWYRHLGIKAVYIAPELNWQACSNPDKWIPVIPGRDDALQCAIIYTWLKEDTWDKDYISTHAVGMEYIEDYILGRSDDMTEKTPQWAAPRCGVKPWTIKALARQWAKVRTSTAHGTGGPMIRGPYTHECARFECILLGMQGLGKPGIIQHSAVQPVQPQRAYKLSARSGSSAWMPGVGGMGYPPVMPQIITRTLTQKAILNGHSEQWGTTQMFSPAVDQFIKYVYPIPAEEGGTEIHLIYQDHACQTACWNDTNEYIKALRSPKIECHVIQHIWMENDCLFADIILPATTHFEDEDVQDGGGEQVAFLYHPAAIEPVGEAKSDYTIWCELAKKLESYGGRYEGLYNKYTKGMTVEDWLKESYVKAGASDLIEWEELKEKMFILSPLAEGWEDTPAHFTKFYEDPDKNPLDTPSGKLEFYSEGLAEHFPDDDERGPYPKYICGGPDWTHDESLDIENGAERCKTYPFLMEANHCRWRVHAQYDDVPWLREIPTCKIRGSDGYMYEPVWINPVDAERKGIKHGDIVKVFNERGTELGGAYVTERIIPGSLHMDHGSRVDMINCSTEDYDERATKWINRGGTLNNISPDKIMSKNCPGMVVSSYLVDIERVTGEEMQMWRDSYPNAFVRDYDPAYGLLFNAWVEGGTE